jgi:MFS transporter, DHA1 family, multidrug resistance protein
MLNPRSLGFTLLLGALAALPALSIDLGLPALPAIGAAFDAAPDETGMTLSLFMLGFALAQLAFGPPSDRFGRKPMLLIGCVLFTIAGIVCTLAGQMAHLIIARFVQGAGAGAGTVLALAIIRDNFEGAEARARISYVSVVLGVAPIVAPSVGAVLVAAGGWRAIYAALALAGVPLCAAVAFAVPESRVASRSARPGYAALLSDAALVGPALVYALSFGGLFAYVSGSPALLIEGYGVSPTSYGLLFACTASGIISGAAFNGWMSGKSTRAETGLSVGLFLAAATAVCLAWLFAGAARPALALAMPLLVANTFSVGLILPNAIHLAMNARPTQAGAASALVGFLQMATGAAASGMVGVLQSGWGAGAMTWAMAGFAIISLLSWLCIEQIRGIARAARPTGASR